MLTLAAHDHGLPPPSQLVLVAPGLTSTFDIVQAHEAGRKCAVLDASTLMILRRHWALGAVDPETLKSELQKPFSGATSNSPGSDALVHPYASPLYGEWSFLKDIPERSRTRIIIVTGTWDFSYATSALPFVKKLDDLGNVSVTLIRAPYAVHNYPLFVDLPMSGLFHGSQQGLDFLISAVLRNSIVS